MSSRSPFALALATLSLLLAAELRAQQIRLGALEGNSALYTSAPLLIDWSRPATATGSVNTATVAWTNAEAPCDSAFFVRFYNIPGNALLGQMTAERGPFRAVNGLNTVSLNPPVDVLKGSTYIAVLRSGADSCGLPYGTVTRTPGRALFGPKDYQFGPLTQIAPVDNFRLQAEASNVPSIRVSTIPAVAAAPGALGSFFRTSLTLANSSPNEIRGKLQFRAANRAGTDADPTLDFTIAPNATLNYGDVVTTMGQSGLGSIDILTTASATPIATARVFNDAGAAGTSGLNEDAVPAGPNALPYAEVYIPADLTNYRLNIGVRTFDAVSMFITVYDDTGRRVFNTTRNYDANYFEQIAGSTFTGGILPAGGRIVVSAVDKEFIVYGAVTDNRTNDPSMRIGND